jgi:hypothetical protein
MNARDVLISISTLRDVVRMMVGETAYPLERRLSILVKQTYATRPEKPSYSDPLQDLLRVSESVDVEALEQIWRDYQHYFKDRVQQLKRQASLEDAFGSLSVGTKSPRLQPDFKRVAKDPEDEGHERQARRHRYE